MNNCKCKKCDTEFVFKPEDVWWNDKGSMYSAKLTKCPECGCINVIRYKEDRGFNLNYDSRYYRYNY